MNYAKPNTISEKTCSHCRTLKPIDAFNSAQKYCRPCKKVKNAEYIRKPKPVVVTEYEPEHLWERKDFHNYADLLISVFRPGEWLTIGEIHRRLGDGVIRKWTYDAICFKGLELDTTRWQDLVRL